MFDGSDLSPVAEANPNLKILHDKVAKVNLEAFPSSIEAMEDTFGRYTRRASAPLKFHKSSKYFDLFSNLKYVEEGLYCRKYLDLCLSGGEIPVYAKGNYNELFTVANIFETHIDEMVKQLANYKEEDIKRIFSFMLDNSHLSDEQYRNKFVSKVNALLEVLDHKLGDMFFHISNHKKNK